MEPGGWYPDPEGGPDRVRWWDGQGWTEHTAPAGSAQTHGPPRPPPPPPGRWERLRTSIAALPRPRGSVVVVAVVIAALVTAGVMTRRDTSPHAAQNPPAPTRATPERRPPLARVCANTNPDRGTPYHSTPPASPGPRITDRDAHISYARQGPPFRRWDRGVWGSESGSLGERFATGQYFITQAVTPDFGPYMATILSGTVPATYGDDPHPDIECAARVIADDMRAQHYPTPNSRRDISAKHMVISGRPAYFLEFHLAFNVPGYNAKGELVAICVVDVPGRNAAALYISIPDTNRRYDKIIPKLIDSVRVNR